MDDDDLATLDLLLNKDIKGIRQPIVVELCRRQQVGIRHFKIVMQALDFAALFGRRLTAHGDLEAAMERRW